MARIEASNLLTRYWCVVTALADRLMEFGMLTGWEVDQITIAARQADRLNYINTNENFRERDRPAST
ncbi:MAG: hypothetical protein HY852_15990 [Bradyrhizobium sp.]|uniref:hypothetical protein n=1 Tax=Bradyrhizobium sp. TaxID=376 RepID=UPI0025C57791|nr:hypothetical protein [Bradyrhizobium sp.]MBI5263310.1 hypothetical protein [Bradyrhizobium sp.]